MALGERLQARFPQHVLSREISHGDEVVFVARDGIRAVAQYLRDEPEMDFNFLEHPDKSFDLIFSRHSLEHSPFPLLSLMEWHRVARNWLILVLPTPRSFPLGGRNHYGIMSASQARFLLERAGWARLWEDHIEEEFRFFCSKVDRVATLDDIKEEYEVEEEE